MFPFKALFLAPVLLLVAAPAFADDLAGANRLICTANSVVVCWDDGTCDNGSAADLNVPQFIEINLAEKILSTTRASGLNRSTPIASVHRDGETIILQGYENGRAFSYVIREKTGVASAAIAAEGRNVAAFGACTPIPASR